MTVGEAPEMISEPVAADTRDIGAALRAIPSAFRLVWRAYPLGTVIMALATLFSAVLPVTQAWVGKLIIDTIVQSLGGQQPAQEGLRAALPFLLLEFGLIVLTTVLAECQMLLRRLLNARLQYTMNSAIIEHALSLDLHYFENAVFYDQLQKARNETEARAMTLLESCFTMAQQVITFGSVIVVLLAFSPFIALILFAAAIPALIAQMRYRDRFVRLQLMRAPELRRMNYLEHLLTVDSSMKEIKLFGLGRPLLNRYRDLFWKFYRQDAALARRYGGINIAWMLLNSSSYYLVYAWIIWRTLSATITLGDMTLFLMLFRQAQLNVQELFDSVGQIYENSRFLQSLFSFLRLPPRMPRAANPRPVPRPIARGIEFRGVSFRYPGHPHWAIHDLHLRIAPGEKLALVGANGAGKTTLVKLLTRLYDPTEGQILLDGVDLREYDLDDLHRRIGVIFQDFVHYQATARENIGFGQIEALDDTARVAAAAQRSGADEVIAALPQQYGTMLGNWFELGQELSGGQWQKIGLGRAFMRDAEVLVLDEPTAALDPRREYEIFQRFRELTDGKIALLISHRFSTVRMADRIIVLEQGRLIEHGTHEELLALEGIYAELFDMQAQGYR